MFSNYSNPTKPTVTEKGLEAAAREAGLDPDLLSTVISVETNGRAYRADGNLPMLFEPHIFYAKLAANNAKLTEAIAKGVAYRHWGERPYPSDSYPRLKIAMAIDEEAALESASWGLPQIMGGNFKEAEYASASSMVADMAVSADRQVMALATFLKDNHLAGHLDRHEWAAFARGYNGPGYAANHYDTKLADAFVRISAAPHAAPAPAPAPLPAPAPAPAVATAPPVAVEAVPAVLMPKTVDSPPTAPAGVDTAKSLFVQKRLVELGYFGAGTPDGDPGPWTESAILDFRNSHNKAFPADQMPLTPVIDDQLILALAMGPPKAIPQARQDVTTSSPNVARRPSVIAAERQKITSGLLAIPAALVAFGDGILNNISTAKGLLDPIKELLSSVPAWGWGGAVLVAAAIVYLDAHKTTTAIRDSVRAGAAL